MVADWKQRLEKVAREQVAARPGLEIEKARILAMENDRELQLPEIRKLWKQAVQH